MTWNIRHGLGNDGRVDLARTAGVIRRSGASIIALLEVDHGWRRSDGENQAAILAGALGMHFAFGSNLLRPDEDYDVPAAYGNAILSAWPLTSPHNAPLPSWHSSERRGLLTALGRHPLLGSLRIACTHLHWGADTTPEDGIVERQGQVA